MTRKPALPCTHLHQALYKLSEPKALVRCRKVDESLVREVLPAAQVRISCKERLWERWRLPGGRVAGARGAAGSAGAGSGVQVLAQELGGCR